MFQRMLRAGALALALALAPLPTSVVAAKPDRKVERDYQWAVLEARILAMRPLGQTSWRDDAELRFMREAARGRYPLRWDDVKLIWPTWGEITVYFREIARTSPRGHAGLDIAAPEGTPVYAAEDGEVQRAAWTDDGYGGLIVLAHTGGYETWYGHLSVLDVKPNQHVRRGELIGAVGSSGYSTGPHLHFEVRRHGELRDPLPYLAPTR